MQTLSLKKQLIVKTLMLQFVTIAVACVGIILMFISSNTDGMYADQTIVDVASQAVVRNGDGTPQLVMTPELAKLRKEAPDLWFHARLADGRVVTMGKIPPEFLSMAANVERFSSADMRGKTAPYTLSAIIRRVPSPAGEMVMIAHGSVTPFKLLISVASNLVAIPMFIALALGSFVFIPLIVRNSLAGVVRSAQEAEHIDVERRGIRLSEDQIPSEVSPLVRAVNDALERLDRGYERQHRFIASAAHELRTPIAILRMKIDGSSHEAARALTRDVARLSTLSEQLLDLHRLDNGAPNDRIKLDALARQVAADLAPLLIAANKTIEVLVDRPLPIMGNAGAVERVLSNLVQNAVEHGGDAVIVRVEGSAFEVEDNGEGIPKADREIVFEPFHRLRPRSSGTGLGLNLVRQVMDHHRGRVAILDAPGGGTIVRVAFPAVV